MKLSNGEQDFFSCFLSFADISVIKAFAPIDAFSVTIFVKLLLRVSY